MMSFFIFYPFLFLFSNYEPNSLFPLSLSVKKKKEKKKKYVPFIFSLVALLFCFFWRENHVCLEAVPASQMHACLVLKYVTVVKV